MSSLMIRVLNVSKEYKLGQIGGTTLRDELQRWAAQLLGKEDPTKVIGTKDYNRGDSFLALDAVSFDVNKKERIGIIGHNGAGKSTLLKLLSRVTAPSGGAIGLNGRIASMLEVGTGFHGELTGRENIYMNGAILGMTKKEIDAKIEDIIDFSECRQFIDTPVKRYSSGMYVKLAFSVAAHLDSEIMIMDEVLAVGDMAFQKKCLNKMRDAATTYGKTVLYVSHNMNTIRHLCDRCIVLDQGRIIFDGDVEKAIKVYLGIPDSQEYPVHYDLYGNKRRYHFGKEVHINSFEFLNKETAIFEVGEIIAFKINLSSVKPISDASLVFSVKTGDVNQIGMALSKKFDILAKENQDFIFEADLSSLAQGKYCLNFEIVEIDNDGNYYSYDNPDARMFVIFQNEFAHGIKWYPQYWANVSFPTIKVK